MTSQSQIDHAAERGLRPSNARVCPHVVAGVRCRWPMGCIFRGRVFDHSCIWWNQAKRQHEMTTEPYQADSEDLAVLFGELHALGLTATVSGDSPWNPGSTLMIHIYRPDIASHERRPAR